MGVDWLKPWLINQGLAGSIPATSTVPRFSPAYLDKISLFAILILVDKPGAWTNLSPPKVAHNAAFWLSARNPAGFRAIKAVFLCLSKNVMNWGYPQERLTSIIGSYILVIQVPLGSPSQEGKQK